MARGGGHPRAVLRLDPRERAAGAGMARDDRGQPGALAHGVARVVVRDVGEHDAVDPAGGGEPHVGVGVDLGARRRELEQQRVVARRERALQPGEEPHEERVGLERGRVARQHQADRAGAGADQRAGRRARLPAQLVGGAQDPRARLRATPGRSLTANDTAAGETPARRATSSIVGRDFACCRRSIRVMVPRLKRFSNGRKGHAVQACSRDGAGPGGTRRRAGAGRRRAVADTAAAGPPRGVGRHARPGARVPGRAVLRQRLAHDRRDGRHHHAAAQAARLGVVRRRRRVGRACDPLHLRQGLLALRPARRRPASS